MLFLSIHYSSFLPHIVSLYSFLIFQRIFIVPRVLKIVLCDFYVPLYVLVFVMCVCLPVCVEYKCAWFCLNKNSFLSFNSHCTSLSLSLPLLFRTHSQPSVPSCTSFFFITIITIPFLISSFIL